MRTHAHAYAYEYMDMHSMGVRCWSVTLTCAQVRVAALRAVRQQQGGDEAALDAAEEALQQAQEEYQRKIQETQDARLGDLEDFKRKAHNQIEQLTTEGEPLLTGAYLKLQGWWCMR